MTNIKSTKRALFSSVIALLLCFTMLLGSTFAWFTDSVTSGRNQIVSGTLDVVLEYKTPDSEDWTEVTSDTVLFGKDTLWEPGYTEVVALRIKNVGTLALKYELATTIYEEVAGINVNGDSFKLSDYLEVGHSAINGDGQIGDILMGLMMGNRETALNGSTMIGFNESIDAPDPILNPGEANVVAMVISMPETVGNEANYKAGTTPPSISFGVTLLATQAANESDSFDNKYDADADYVTYFTSGINELNATLKATKATDVITAEGAETIVNIRGGYYDAGNQDCAVWAKDGATVNIYDGFFTHNGDGTEATSAHHFDMIYAGANGGKINIYGGTYSAKSGGVWLLNEKDRQGEIVVYGGSFVNWNPADNDSEGAHTNFVAEGYEVVTTQQGDDTIYTVVQLASSASELKNAIADAAEGTTIVLTNDIQIGANQLAIEKDVTVDMNGQTLSADYGWGIVSMKNGASIKNGTIDVMSNVAAIRAFNAGSIENVTINISPKATEKVATAIAVQEGGYVGTIKNVTITGATQGIEILKGAKVDFIENVNVQAVSNGSKQGIALQINAGYVGKAVNSSFNGETYGVHMMLNGENTVALELDNCIVSGTTAGIYAHDETGISNTTNCSLTLTYDAETVINGDILWQFEEECQSVITLNKPN